MSPPASTRYPFVCVTCDLLITERPTFHVGLPFCCAGCVAGGPCVCSYDLAVREVRDGAAERRAEWVVHSTMLVEEPVDERELVAVG
jgi:hypothetical protein